MKIQLLYIFDCPWCVKTKRLIGESLRELKVKAKTEEILIDTEKKANRYKFVGSPTVRINGKDIQKKVTKAPCLPCEELADLNVSTTEFVKQECKCGCRIYFYRGKLYPYPPKGMIKEAIKREKR
jgi:glutaredoxin